MSGTTATTTKTENVLLYIPNLIGYSRVAFTMIAFFLMITDPRQWLIAVTLYLASFVGDLFDGMAARKFNQCSNFGGLLDMVTDRCSTLGLLYILGGEYTELDTQRGFPWWRLLFLSLIILDISSHWCQMYSTCSLQKHHKSKDSNAGRNIIVQLYYDVYLFFGYCCVGAELTYVGLYMTRHLVDESWAFVVHYALYACIPGCAIKQIVNVYQLCSACYAVAENDATLKNKQGK